MSRVKERERENDMSEEDRRWWRAEEKKEKKKEKKTKTEKSVLFEFKDRAIRFPCLRLSWDRRIALHKGKQTDADADTETHPVRITRSHSVSANLSPFPGRDYIT